MENNRQGEKTSLGNVLGDFMDSYTNRDESTEFSDWLAERIRQEIPDMPEETGRKLAGDIIEAVAGYDRTLETLKAAEESGQSSEEWLAERMEEAYAEMPIDEAGEKLQEIEGSYISSNAQFVGETGGSAEYGENAEDADTAGWDKYGIKDKAYKIGRQAALFAVAVAAKAVKEKVENNDSVGIGNIVKEALWDGLGKDPAEVKAVVAGAVKIAVEKGLENRLADDTPIEAMCDMAGAAVEGAEALFDVVNGKSTMIEALDRIVRAGIAAAGHLCAYIIKGVLPKLPGGFLLADLLGGVLDHLKGPVFVENIHRIGIDIFTMLRDVAVDAWKGFRRVTAGCPVGNMEEVRNGGKVSIKDGR